MKLLFSLYLFFYLLLMVLLFGGNFLAGRKDYNQAIPSAGEPVKYRYYITIKRELV